MDINKNTKDNDGASQAKDPLMTCPVCGKVSHASLFFCPECGARLDFHTRACANHEDCSLDCNSCGK